MARLEQTCGTCGYSILTGRLSAQRKCFRYPPQAVIVRADKRFLGGETFKTEFHHPSVTDATPGCGEYRPLPTAKL